MDVSTFYALFSATCFTLVAIHALVGLVAAFPAVAAPLGLRPIQVAALLLVSLVALGHGLVWHHLVHEAAGTTG